MTKKYNMYKKPSFSVNRYYYYWNLYIIWIWASSASSMEHYSKTKRNLVHIWPQRSAPTTFRLHVQHYFWLYNVYFQQLYKKFLKNRHKNNINYNLKKKTKMKNKNWNCFCCNFYVLFVKYVPNSSRYS